MARGYEAVVTVRPYGAPQGLEQQLHGYVVDSTATHICVALQGQDGEVYRNFKHEQVTIINNDYSW